ncbi:MAG: hypothetical protein AAFR61_29245 [Bacteroidota bacterium]
MNRLLPFFLFAWLLPGLSQAQEWKQALRCVVETHSGQHLQGQIVAVDSGALYLALSGLYLPEQAVDYPVVRLQGSDINRIRVKGRLFAPAHIWLLFGTAPMTLAGGQYWGAIEGWPLRIATLISMATVGTLAGQYLFRKSINLQYELDDSFQAYLPDWQRYASHARVGEEKLRLLARSPEQTDQPDEIFQLPLDFLPANQLGYANPEKIRTWHGGAYIFGGSNPSTDRSAGGIGFQVAYQLRPQWRVGVAGEMGQISREIYIPINNEFWGFAASQIEKWGGYLQTTYVPFPQKEAFRKRLSPYATFMLGAHNLRGYHVYREREVDGEAVNVADERPDVWRPGLGLGAGLSCYLWRWASIDAWGRYLWDPGFLPESYTYDHPSMSAPQTVAGERIAAGGLHMGFQLNLHF